MPSQFRIVVSLLRVLAQRNTHVCQLSPDTLSIPTLVALILYNNMLFCETQ